MNQTHSLQYTNNEIAKNLVVQAKIWPFSSDLMFASGRNFVVGTLNHFYESCKL